MRALFWFVVHGLSTAVGWSINPDNGALIGFIVAVVVMALVEAGIRLFGAADDAVGGLLDFDHFDID